MSVESKGDLRKCLFEDNDIKIEYLQLGILPSRVLIITFDPISYNVDQPHYARDFLRKLDVDVISVRKKWENFYQPLGRDQFSLIVNTIVGKYERVVAYGSSLGAYAALYFCGQLDCEIVSSSPRVSVYPVFGIQRWQAKVNYQHVLLSRLPKPRARTLIAFDPCDSIDNPFIAQEVLKAFPDATVLHLKYSGHPSNFFLNEIGYINRLMRAIVSGEERPTYRRKDRNRSWTYFQVLSEHMLRRGRVELALKLIEKSLSLNQKNSIAHRTLANIYIEKNDLSSALASIDRASSLNSKDENIAIIKNRILSKKSVRAECVVESNHGRKRVDSGSESHNFSDDRKLTFQKKLRNLIFRIR